MDMLAASLRPTAEKYMNAIAEMFQEMGQMLGDALLFMMATRMAEACIRCHM